MWTKGEGFYAEFKYVETARFVMLNDGASVIRDKTDGENVLVDYNEYIKTLPNVVGVYTSIFRYRKPAIDDLQLGNLYFDFDSPVQTKAHADAIKLVDHLLNFIPIEGIRIYFSGFKGFHIECEIVPLGISPGVELHSIYRYIATDLQEKLNFETLDFQVYDKRRMWRVPNTKHQKGGRYKIPLTLEELRLPFDTIFTELANNPRDEVEVDLEFDIKANEWYRDYTYQYEESRMPKKYTAQSIIDRFNTFGSTHIPSGPQEEFNPIALFKHCPAVLQLWKKAETQHHLEHEERLFLCSLLTYTDDAIEYLHSILQNCTDYRYEKTQAHIDDWVRRREYGIGGRPFTCARAVQAGIVCSGCDKLEPKPKYEKIGESLYPTQEFSEPSPIRFCYMKEDKSDVGPKSNKSYTDGYGGFNF